MSSYPCHLRQSVSQTINTYRRDEAEALFVVVRFIARSFLVNGGPTERAYYF